MKEKDDLSALEKRVDILKETIERLFLKEERERLRAVAMENVDRWAKISEKEKRGREERLSNSIDIRIYEDDWGVAAKRVTKEFGKVFAVLNMANSRVAGGGYLSGMIAQEENMFRRTDCHFKVMEWEHEDEDVPFEDVEELWYDEDMTDLLNARFGEVYLDVDEPRICVRGQEDLSKESLGYEWHDEAEVFPFYELRAAAHDLRGGAVYSDKETRKRIRAQLETLKTEGVRHVVLSAFGCGAFKNPADKVAACYKGLLDEYREDFDVVCFAIYHAGYGNNNYVHFREVFK